MKGVTMANNRLFIEDTETGDRFLLAKCLSDGWYVFDLGADKPSLQMRLSTFFGGEYGQRDMPACIGGDEPTKFKLVTENSL